MYSVSHSKRLTKDIDLIDKIEIYDEPLTYTGKDRGTFSETLGYETLHIRKVHTYGRLLLVDQDDIGIITIALHIDNFGTFYAKQFISRIYI